MFNKKQFNDVCILVLIVLFSCLIIYQIYLAINNNKYGKNYSKLIEGLGNITAQGKMSCDSNSLPSNIHNIIMTDISNIEILYNNVNSISSQVNVMIKNNNANSSNTYINDISLNTISSPTITATSDDSSFCTAINTNLYNINLINENIGTIKTSVGQLPNGQNDLANAVFQSLTTNNSISPCSPISQIPISSLCLVENTNINNINVLSGNASSLNNVVTNMTNSQNNKLNNQYSTASTISSSAGVNTN